MLQNLSFLPPYLQATLKVSCSHTPSKDIHQRFSLLPSAQMDKFLPAVVGIRASNCGSCTAESYFVLCLKRYHKLLWEKDFFLLLSVQMDKFLQVVVSLKTSSYGIYTLENGFVPFPDTWQRTHLLFLVQTNCF